MCDSPTSIISFHSSNSSQSPPSCQSSSNSPSLSQNYYNSDEILDVALNDLEKRENIIIFESKEIAAKRKKIILEIEKLTTDWIRECLYKFNCLSNEEIAKSSSYIKTFGSYELNAHFESSDLDLLCIGPKHITRDMLFNEFVKKLENDNRVTGILQLPHAFVPLLKFTFNGIDIDLVYSRWNVDIINKNLNVFSSNYISEKESIFSLNGVRTTEIIKKLIPNNRIFEKSLRIIKIWAQRRSIYSNVMGFLGGISWSIMVACICIQNPHQNVIGIIYQFFKIYNNKLNKSSVYIDINQFKSNKIQKKNCCDSNLILDNYEEQYKSISSLITILTPARPRMNCAYNVIESTKEKIRIEIERGYTLLNNNNNNNINCYLTLLQKRYFIPIQIIQNNQYYYEQSVYIHVQCISDINLLHRKSWTSFIESKIRNLTKKLQHKHNRNFYPYPNSIRFGNDYNFFIQGTIDIVDGGCDDIIINQSLNQFRDSINNSSVKLGKCKQCKIKTFILNYNQINQLLLRYNYPNSEINSFKTQSNSHHTHHTTTNNSFITANNRNIIQTTQQTQQTQQPTSFQFLHYHVPQTNNNNNHRRFNGYNNNNNNHHYNNNQHRQFTKQQSPRHKKKNHRHQNGSNIFISNINNPSLINGSFSTSVSAPTIITTQQAVPVPVTLPVAVPVTVQTQTSTPISVSLPTQPPTTTIINLKPLQQQQLHNNHNHHNNHHHQHQPVQIQQNNSDSDTNSNTSIDTNQTINDNKNTTQQPQQNIQNVRHLRNIQNIRNISQKNKQNNLLPTFNYRYQPISFPIISIQQQKNPHFAPIVSTQNTQKLFDESLYSNSNNNTTKPPQWLFKMLANQPIQPNMNQQKLELKKCDIPSKRPIKLIENKNIQTDIQTTTNNQINQMLQNNTNNINNLNNMINNKKIKTINNIKKINSNRINNMISNMKINIKNDIRKDVENKTNKIKNDTKSNSEMIIPRGYFIPHKRVKIPDIFEKDLDTVQNEQFGYPSPPKQQQQHNNDNNQNIYDPQSTLVVHPTHKINKQKKKQQLQKRNNDNNETNNNKNDATNNRGNSYSELIRSYAAYCNIINSLSGYKQQPNKNASLFLVTSSNKGNRNAENSTIRASSRASYSVITAEAPTPPPPTAKQSQNINKKNTNHYNNKENYLNNNYKIKKNINEVVAPAPTQPSSIKSKSRFKPFQENNNHINIPLNKNCTIRRYHKDENHHNNSSVSYHDNLENISYSKRLWRAKSNKRV